MTPIHEFSFPIFSYNFLTSNFIYLMHKLVMIFVTLCFNISKIFSLKYFLQGWKLIKL